MSVTTVILKFINLFINKFLDRFEQAQVTYAQEGEDIILQRCLVDSPKSQGVYVDIGAHHPKRFSNTYKLYLEGWSGLCVDPTKKAESLFKKYRPRDKFVNVGVGLENKELDYFVFDEPALNTFDQKLAADRERNTRYKIIEKEKVQMSPLSSILSQYCSNVDIDVMSVDTEGFDLQVLQSNDWGKYRPNYILIEELDGTDGTIKKLLESRRYKIIAKTYNTLFFKRND